jgi:hypothetical protein
MHVVEGYFQQQTGLKFKQVTNKIKCYIWSIALFGGEVWTLRKEEGQLEGSYKKWRSIIHTTAKDNFYKGIQKLYDPANLCVQLEEMYVEN